MACCTASVAIAASHIACNSLGGPGSTTTVGVPGMTAPGAVPTGCRTVAPTGTMACLRLASRSASISVSGNRAIHLLTISPIVDSNASSRTSSRPQKRATVSTVISSAVGPRPPVVTTRSTPSACRKRNCASISAARSPQMVMWANSTPSSSRRSATQGPLRSVTRPVRTSVPVTRIPARALTSPTQRRVSAPPSARRGTGRPSPRGICAGRPCRSPSSGARGGSRSGR